MDVSDELCRISVRAHPDVVVVQLSGELDVSNVGHVSAEIAAAAIGMPLVLDLSELGFLDSSAIHWLFRLARSARAYGPPLSVVSPADCPAERSFRFVDPREDIPRAADMDAALSNVRADPAG
jgi:anti-anti-sigma factor